jgi:hypothetical protein
VLEFWLYCRQYGSLGQVNKTGEPLRYPVAFTPNMVWWRWRPPTMKPKRNHRTNRPKRVLRLPDLEHARTAVLNSLSSRESQRGYRHAIDEFVDWYCSEPRLAFNRIVVLRYRSHLESRRLSPATINLRRGAVRRLAYEAADCGLLSSDLAAGIRRVKGLKKSGVRMGNWRRLSRLIRCGKVLAMNESRANVTVPCWPFCWLAD